jgi:hypothetical protein
VFGGKALVSLAVTAIGPDIAKPVFQVHRIDAAGNAIDGI